VKKDDTNDTGELEYPAHDQRPFAIAHLSDLHFREDPKANSLLGRGADVGRFIASRLAEWELGELLVIITGDIAYSGLTEEYRNFDKFWRAVVGQLKVPPHLIACPGNHDCNFREEDGTRRALRATPPIDKLDASVVNNFTNVQAAYWDWARKLSLSPADGLGGRLVARKTIPLGGSEVDVFALNSAWLSQYSEETDLQLPVHTLKEATGKAGRFRICLLHHPLTWFHPDNSRALGRLLRERFAMVFLGHEHDGDAHRQVDPARGETVLFDGEVLQSRDPRLSKFRLYRFDPAAKSISGVVASWANSLYEGSKVVRSLHVGDALSTGAVRFTKEHESFLNDPGIAFPNARNLTIDEIYVCPDFRGLDYVSDSDGKVASLKAEAYVERLLEVRRLCILAEEKSGRTSLAKHTIKELAKRGIPCLYVEGKQLVDAAAISELWLALPTQQISEPSGEQLRQTRRRGVIVDGGDVAWSSSRAREIASFLEQFEIVVMIGTPSRQLESIARGTAAAEGYAGYLTLEMLPLGHARRAVLIEAWLRRRGRRGENVRPAEHDRLLQSRTEQRVREILGRDLVPSYPLYILLILEHIDAQQAQSPISGSLGYLYDGLIHRMLSRAVPSEDLDSYWNWLKEFAAFLYIERSSLSCSYGDLRTWHEEYCTRFAVDLEKERLIDKLSHAEVLRVVKGEDEIFFKYKYYFCYFLARYLADHLDETHVRELVSGLSRSLHDELRADVFLFLSHSSRQRFVIESLLASTRQLLQRHPRFAFKGSNARIGTLVTPLHALPDSAPRENRRRALEEQDALEPRISARDWVGTDTSVPSSVDSDTAVHETLECSAAFRSVQILGQTLRNHAGSLDAARKLEIARECLNLGMRILEFFLAEIDHSRDEIAEMLGGFLRQRADNLTRDEKDRLNARVLSGVIEAVGFAVLRHVAESIGADTLSKTYEQLLHQDKAELAEKLLDVLVSLEHGRGFPKKKVLDLAKDSSNERLAFAVLRRIVFFHFYTYDSERSLRQQICKKLEIAEAPKMLKGGRRQGQGPKGRDGRGGTR
jgi:hypothetical protein